MRFIEVKGRAAVVGEVALSDNEYRDLQSASKKDSHWLFTVAFNCGTESELHLSTIRRASAGNRYWSAHYHVGPEAVLKAAIKPTLTGPKLAGYQPRSLYEMIEVNRSQFLPHPASLRLVEGADAAPL